MSETFHCRICGKELDPVEEGSGPTCDGCWYGMRLMPGKWKREMKAKGIQVERTEFPIPLKNGGHISGDPYRKKGDPRMTLAEITNLEIMADELDATFRAELEEDARRKAVSP